MRVMPCMAAGRSRKLALILVTTVHALLPVCRTMGQAPEPPGGPIGTHWDDSKAASLAFKEAVVAAAGTVVTGAELALRSAKLELKKAQDLQRIGGLSVGLSARTIATLSARVLAAEAAVTAAEETALTVATGAFVTGAGLGVEQLGSWAWDRWFASRGPDWPPLQPFGPDPFHYVPPTSAELRALTLSLVSSVAGRPVTDATIDSAGPLGLVARNFVEQGSAMFIESVRGTALAGAGHLDEARMAAADLAILLPEYRATVEELAAVIATAHFVSPVAEVTNARREFLIAADAALAECAGLGVDCTPLVSALDQATRSIDAALAALQSVRYPSLVGGADALLPDITLTGFDALIAEAATKGEAALPPAEVVLVQQLLAFANVRVVGTSSVGEQIAAWLAVGDDNGRESALFDRVTGVLRVDDLQRGYATTLSCGRAGCVGPWMGIDPLAAPMFAPEPQKIALLGLGLLMLRGVASVARTACGRRCSVSDSEPQMSQITEDG